MRFARIVVACLLVACAPPHDDSLSPAAVERAIKERMASYGEAIGRLDSAGIIDHYVAGPDFRLVSDGASYSFDQMQGLIGALKAALRSSEVRWDTLVVTPLGPDAGLVYAPFRRVDTDAEGRVARLRGVATWLWVRRDGEWRSLYGHGDHYPDTSAVR